MSRWARFVEFMTVAALYIVLHELWRVWPVPTWLAASVTLVVFAALFWSHGDKGGDDARG